MAVKQLVTADEFLAMPDVPGKWLELVEGELVEMPGTGYVHAQLVRTRMLLLNAFVVAHDTGEVFADGLGYLTRRMPDTVRVPDVSFIAAERIPDEGFPSYVPFAPDLAVEVVSPGDRDEEIQEKVRQYLAAGMRLIWVVRPKSRSVSVHTWSDSVRQLGPADGLDGGDVLPGFAMRVSELFVDVH